MGLREKAYASARSRGLAPQDAYDAVDEETAAGPSSGDSVPLEQFMSMVEKHQATARPESTAGEIGEPVQAPERMPPPAPDYKAPSLPEPMRMPKAPPPEPQESSADRLAAAIDRQNRATKWRGVSDALYAATAATPLQPMQSPDFASQESALEKARGADTAALMKKALGDPRSPESMRARALLEGTGIGQRMKQRLGSRWDELTATALPELGDIIRAEAAKKEGGDGPGGMTAYQQWEIEEKKRKAESEAKDLEAARKSWAPVLRELGIDPTTASKDDIHLAMQRDSSLATREMARAQFGYKKDRDVTEDVKDLSKTVGADPAHLEGLLSRLDAAAAQTDIPGVGPADRLVPDMVASGEALQTRNDMREAVRTMLTMKSGKTVTPQEAQDYAKIYGIDGSEEAFRQGVARLRKDVADALRAKKAGFQPEAVQRYEGRGGASTPSAPTESPPAGLIPPGAKNVKKLKSGRWYYELNGEPETVGAESR